MKKCVTAILLLLMAASIALSVQKPAEWIKYTSPEGRYSILLPAQPEVGSKESATAGGEKFTLYQATLWEGNSVYLIGYFDYAAGAIYSLDEGRDGMIEAVKGTLLSESAIGLGGSPGRELKVAVRRREGAEFILRARIYDVDKRVYALQFVNLKSEDGKGTAEKAARFFDSFQVTKTR